MSKSSILFFGGGGERKASSETTILRCVFAASFAQPFSSLGVSFVLQSNLSGRSFPKQFYLWGSILEKKWLDTLVGALGRVGRGFGSAGRAELCWGVGFGRAGRAGLGWARLLWVYFDLVDLLALFAVYAGIIEPFLVETSELSSP